MWSWGEAALSKLSSSLVTLTVDKEQLGSMSKAWCRDYNYLAHFPYLGPNSTFSHTKYFAIGLIGRYFSLWVSENDFQSFVRVSLQRGLREYHMNSAESMREVACINLCPQRRSNAAPALFPGFAIATFPLWKFGFPKLISFVVHALWIESCTINARSRAWKRHF